MLGKLLKHEFRATSRILPIVFGASGLAILLCFIFKQLKIDVLIGTTGFLSVIGIIASMILTIVFIITRYYKSMYSTEGYLGGTLPVSSNLMIASKAIVAFVWVIAGTIVCTILSFAFVSIFANVTDVFNVLGQVIGSSKLVQQGIIFFLVIATLEIIYFIAGIYFCITLSNTPPFQRMGIGGAVLIYVIYYLIASAISVLFMLIIPFGIKISPDGINFIFQPMISSLTNAANSSMSPIYTSDLGLGSFVFEAIMSVVFFILTAFFGKKYASVR